MVNVGLEGIIVAETATSMVDGAAGRLWIRGIPVGDLSRAGRLEDAVALLWDGTRDTAPARRRSLGAARVAAWPVVRAETGALAGTDGMVVLRRILSCFEGEDPELMVSAMAVAVASWIRCRSGEAPLPPDPDRSPADDLFRCMTGAPDPVRALALGRYLCAVVDHGMNASTFTARVVTSTEADRVSAVVAALGALSGPLHGGAPGPVLDMLDAIGHPDAAAGWIAAELAAGRRIMGMGHRVYRVRDPRAEVLEYALGELARDRPVGRLALAQSVEQAAQAALAAHRPGRSLKANVEFYTAVLLDALGIHRSAFTPMFAVGRVVGWMAHVDEQRREGRLIRPKAAYVGPKTQ